MVFFIDDLLLRAIGISIPPFDMIWVLEQLRDFAYGELYNPRVIGDQIKENRLFFEVGEITKEEYEKNHAELTHKLRLANRVREMNLDNRLDILGLKVEMPAVAKRA